MPVVPAAQRVTRTNANGVAVTLSAREWALLVDAYAAVGLPASSVVVVQGSWHHGSASGTTHDGGGAFDLRVWNLPASKVEPLISALRSRGVCAWKRDKAHGGFDPHIHGIDRFEAGLSRGALYQVREYDQGRDGLASQGRDYHPRPVQRKWVYGPQAAPFTASEYRAGTHGPVVATMRQALRLPAGDVWDDAVTTAWGGYCLRHPWLIAAGNRSFRITARGYASLTKNL
ncbi:MAG: hypothetical protein U0R76_10695 [Candidatus Nanopelagicales bacterium]